MKDEVKAPATALMIVGGMMSLTNFVALLADLILNSGIKANLGQWGDPEAGKLAMFGTFAVIIAVLGIGWGLAICYGAIKMRNHSGYALAMMASIMAVVPCLGLICVLVSMPIGIWALVKLRNPDVRASFSRTGIADSQQPLMARVYCTNCGQRIDDRALYCPWCGVALK